MGVTNEHCESHDAYIGEVSDSSDCPSCTQFGNGLLHALCHLAAAMQADLVYSPVVGSFLSGCGQPRTSLEQYVIERVGELTPHLLQLNPHTLHSG